jgi:hypothetical protein
MKCQNQSANISHCNCTYSGCSRHGHCCECLTYHRASSELPACYFTKEEERTYNRSIRYFVERRK